MSGKHPNVRQASNYQAGIQLPGRHPNVRQASKCQAGIQMSGKHPTTRQKSDVRQSPDMPHCPEICHNAPKYATMLPKYAIFWTNIFDFLFSPQNCPKRALRALGGPGGPWGPYFPYFSFIFLHFSPLWGPLFSPLSAL